MQNYAHRTRVGGAKIMASPTGFWLLATQPTTCEVTPLFLSHGVGDYGRMTRCRSIICQLVPEAASYPSLLIQWRR